tara:strand:+ start:54985 stop:56337 length:1353 start_codon:yes stop_codon:yes gene_type:complete
MRWETRDEWNEWSVLNDVDDFTFNRGAHIKSSGTDPQLEAACALPAGRKRLTILYTSESDLRACLYWKNSPTVKIFDDNAHITIPLQAAPSVTRQVVEFTTDDQITHIRIDPHDSPCDLVISSLSVESVDSTATKRDSFVEHLGTLGLDPENVFPPVSPDGFRRRPEYLPTWPDDDIDETQVRLLDSQGFVIKRGLLSPDQVGLALDYVQTYLDHPESAYTPGAYKFSFMELHPLFFHIMEHPWILNICARFLGDIFRLDHTFGADTPAGSTLHELHGGPLSGFGHNIYSPGLPLDRNISRVGLINFHVSLTGCRKELGGLCCIPGSHNTSDYAVRNRQGDAAYCDRLDDLQASDSLVVPECEPGDCIAFLETLVHGAYPSAQRRTSLYYKYSSGISCFRAPEELAHYPKYAFTEQQRVLLTAPGALGYDPERYTYLPGYLRWRPDSILK